MSDRRTGRTSRDYSRQASRRHTYQDTFYDDMLVDEQAPFGSGYLYSAPRSGRSYERVNPSQTRYSQTRFAKGGKRYDSEDFDYAADFESNYDDGYEFDDYSNYSRSSYGAESYDARSRYSSDRYAGRRSGSYGNDGSRRYGSSAADGYGDDDGYGDYADRGRRDYRAPKRKARKGVIAAIIVAALVLVGAGTAFAYFSSVSNNLQQGVDDDLRSALVQTDMANEPFYLLLLGTDGSAERDGDEEFGGMYRSDSMMLTRIDPVQKKVALVSISRDTMVDLGDEYGEQKINAAYGLGGPAMAVKAVSQLAGVDISHYASVDFDAFCSLVDALGGVEVDVPVDIDDWEAGGSLSAGLQTLNGDEALILCRSRNTYVDTAAHPDAMRAANQRLVLSAIAKKLLASDIATIAMSVQAMSGYVTTDLGITDIIGLAQAMQGLDSTSDIYTAMAPTDSQYIDDIWCEFIDTKKWKTMMERIEEGLPPTEETEVDEFTGTIISSAGTEATLSATTKNAAVTVKNATERQGLAAQTRTDLMGAGFQNVIIGDVAEGYSYPYTLVIYDHASGEREAQEIVQVLGQGQTFQNDGSYLLADCDFLVIIGDDWKSTSSSSSSSKSAQ